jgi:hypothetical protein
MWLMDGQARSDCFGRQGGNRGRGEAPMWTGEVAVLYANVAVRAALLGGDLSDAFGQVSSRPRI